MTYHLPSFAIGEMAMPLMETPEQQEILNLKEQLEMNQMELQKTKYQLEIAEIKRASEVEGFKNAIQCLVLHNQTSSKNNFEAENESKIEMLKLKLEKVHKKFDDSKEQISKGQEQDERIEKLEKANFEKDEKIQELEEVVRQNACRLEMLEKVLPSFDDKREKRDLEYEELKKKYKELQEAMENLELKHSQLQQQLQQLQQEPNKMAENNETPALRSKELEECVSVFAKYVRACLNRNDNNDNQRLELSNKFLRSFKALSKEDQKKCTEIVSKIDDSFKR